MKIVIVSGTDGNTAAGKTSSKNYGKAAESDQGLKDKTASAEKKDKNLIRTDSGNSSKIVNRGDIVVLRDDDYGYHSESGHGEGNEDGNVGSEEEGWRTENQTDEGEESR